MAYRWLQRLIVITFFLFSSLGVVAQQKDARQILFTEWIQKAELKYGVTFSYNHTLFDNFNLSIPPCEDLKKCMLLVSASNPIKFEATEPGHFLIIPIRKSASFEIVDGETGDPIEVLRIQINQEPEYYLVSDDKGYEIDNLFPTDSIHIATRFYSTLHIQADKVLSQSAQLKMSSDPTYLEEVIIQDYLAVGVDSKLSDHSIEIDMSRLGILAGETDGDIFYLLKALPGIGTPDGKPGSLNFRGSTPDHTLIYFDEIPIYHFGHFFGTISPYNPAAVSKIKVHRGTMPAKWGGRVGGMIDLQTNNSVANSLGIETNMNTVYSGVKAEIPVAKNKAGISLAARSNYPVDYLFPKLEAYRALNFQGSKVDPTRVGGQNMLDQFDVRFHDENAKVIYNINKEHQLTLSLMNIQNHFAYGLNSQDQDKVEKQISDLDNWGITTKWKGNLNDHFTISTSFTLSDLNIYEANTETEGGLIIHSDYVSNKINDLRFNTSLEYYLNSQSTFEIGYQMANQKVDFNEQRGLDEEINVRNAETHIHSVHGSLRQSIGTRFVSSIGLRTDYYSLLDKYTFDPRLSISYMVSDFFFLKGSGGVSHQFIKQQFKKDFSDFKLQNQFWFLADEQNPILEGLQSMAGILYDRSGWLIDAEFYLKKTNGVLRQLDAQTDEIGSLQSKGLDLFIKKRWNILESWVSYSLTYTETTFSETEKSFFDQRNVLSLTFLVRHNKRWNYALSWSYLSGMPVAVPELDPDHQNSNGQTKLSVPYTDNFPAQHQLDFSATYKFWEKDDDLKGLIGVSFQNIYDKKNILNIYQNDPPVDQPYRYAIGFAPNLNLRVSF